MSAPAVHVDSLDDLVTWTRAFLLGNDDLLCQAERVLASVVPQLEQAIGAGAIPVEVAPLVGHARRLRQRIQDSRIRSRPVRARWSS